MITKAIVEEIIDACTIRVRIPSIDRTYQSSVHVRKEDLDVGVICTLPGCHPNLSVNDVVIVSSDDAEEDLIILGQLYRPEKYSKNMDLFISSLNVNGSTQLSFDTYIGKVTPEELSQLSGVKRNIQFYHDELDNRLNTLNNTLTTTVSALQTRIDELHMELIALKEKVDPPKDTEA